MSQPKIKIGRVSLERIRRLRESGKSINYIANKYAWPRSVINRICAGVDVEFFRRKPKRNNRTPKKGCCTCCHIRPIAPDFRYLCEFCWQTAESGEVYPTSQTGASCQEIG